MTTSLTDGEKDALIRSLKLQLDVAKSEVSLHLSEVIRQQFIVSEITEAAEGGIFERRNLKGDYFRISDQLADILGFGDVGMPHSYSQFLENVHPDDLAEALDKAELRQGREAPKTSERTGPMAIDITESESAGDVPLNIFPTEKGDHLEFRYRNQQGEYRWFRASAKSYHPEGGPAQIIGLIIDIHDVKVLEAQRKAVLDELKAFMYSVAHDLRAPVRHIASFAEAIREEPDAPADERELYLSYVEQSAEKLGKMIDGLLKLSRNQNYVPRIVPVDVEVLLDALIEKTRQTEQQAPELIINHDRFPIIETDADLIEQVLQNLLSNAIKYSSNEPKAEINIRYHLQEAQHVITFSDNGIGFDPAYADKLFKLFSRLYVDEDIAGTGVGLASVHRIMRHLNGTIEADGKLGEGATFTLRIPVKVGATSAF